MFSEGGHTKERERNLTRNPENIVFFALPMVVFVSSYGCHFHCICKVARIPFLLENALLTIQ